MMTIHKNIIGLCMMMFLATAVSGFEIDSTTYEAFNYHLGLGGSTGNTSSYSLRATTTFEQGGSQAAESASYTLNPGIYYLLDGDVEAPVISNITPEDDYYTQIQSNIFTANVVNNGNLASVAVYGSWGGWGAKQTNNSGIEGDYEFNVSVLEGTYVWAFYACDAVPNCAFSENQTIHIDLTNPNVTLITPANNGSWTSSSTVTFTYNATDAIGIDFCELYVNNVFLKNSSTIINGTNTFSRDFSNGVYNWTVNCTDLSGRTTQPSTNSFTQLSSLSGGGGGTTNNYETGLDINKLVDDVNMSRAQNLSENNQKILLWLLIICLGWFILGYKRDKENYAKKYPKNKIYIR
jgi:hypothetical protein